MLKKHITLVLPLLAAHLAACHDDDNASTVTNTGTMTVTSVVSNTGSPPAAASLDLTAIASALLKIHSIAQQASVSASSVSVSPTSVVTGQYTQNPVAGSGSSIVPTGQNTQTAVTSPVANGQNTQPAASGDAASSGSSGVSQPTASGGAASSGGSGVSQPAASGGAASSGSSGVSQPAPSASSVGAPPASAATGAATTATSGCKTYTMKKDDTAYAVAKAHGINDIAQITALNPGVVYEKLQIGAVLVFPPSATGSDLGSAPDCKKPAGGAAAAGSSASSGGAPPAASPAASSGGVQSASSPAASVSQSSSPKQTGSVGQTVVPVTSTPSGTASVPTGEVTLGGSPPTGVEPVSALTYMGATADCSGATQNKDECVPAKDAAPFIVKAFADYTITTAEEQAAILSIMIFESGKFMYKRNHFPAPGNPGQGTTNMMSPTYVAEYAASFPELSDGIAKAAGDKAKILDLVVDNKYSFGSASWFYAKKCSDADKKGVKLGTTAGYTSYLRDCVGTDPAPERLAGYDLARKALGVPIAP
jgi:hypothetical protein